MQNKHFIEIDLAKGFAIILAVFGHAAPDAVKGFYIIGTDSLSAQLHYLIYSFHMPLFFACSGFLLYPKIYHNEGQVYKRFKKLMIPYFFLSFVYLCAKLIGEELADNPLTENPIIGIFFGKSPCFGAWFLWVLFVMTFIVLSLRKVRLEILLIVFISISYLPIDYADNYFGIAKVQANITWLVLGCLTRQYYEFIEKKINLLIGVTAAFILITIHVYSHMIPVVNHLVMHSVSLIKTLSGITASFALCYLLAKNKPNSLISRHFKLCSEYCMDIYIISMFVLVPMRILYVNVGLVNYIPYYIWLMIATLLGVIIPIYVSKYFIRKTKVLKLVLLGG